MIHIVTWYWGRKYAPHYVTRLREGVRRHLRRPHRFVLMADRLESWMPAGHIHGGFETTQEIRSVDRRLLTMPGCLVRLRMFEHAWQAGIGAEPGDLIVCMDLDSIVTGELDPLFDQFGLQVRFAILQGANAANPCPYNGSLMMLRAGDERTQRRVWQAFSLEAVQASPFHAFPDDQGWLAAQLPNEPGWIAGQDGVYAFHKPGWPAASPTRHADDLPPDARLVVFPGSRDPAQYTHLPWVREFWR